MVHTPTWAWVALPELIFNRLLCAGEDNFFFLSKLSLLSLPCFFCSKPVLCQLAKNQLCTIHLCFCKCSLWSMPNKIKGNWLYVLWCITLLLGLVQDLLRDLQISSNAMRACCCFLQTAQKCKVQLLLLLKPWADQTVCSEVQWQNLEVLEHKREKSLDSGEFQRGTSHVVTCLCSFSFPDNFF